MGETLETSQYRLLDLRVPRSDADVAADFLWRHGAQAVEESGASDDAVSLSTDLGEDPIGAYESAILSDPTVESFASRWSATIRTVDAAVADTWREFVEDLVVADVVVRPAWKSRDTTDDAGERLQILIDPGGAFGMGDHPTTRGTLDLARVHARVVRPSRILDLGCGSGVLAIALLADSTARATAVDIARPAVEATRANARLNGLSERMDVALGDVRSVEGVFDVVLANILAPVLLADATDIVARIAPRGTVILSGFTDTRRSDILAAYESLGCRLVDQRNVDGWWSLQMQRRDEGLEVE